MLPIIYWSPCKYNLAVGRQAMQLSYLRVKLERIDHQIILIDKLIANILDHRMTISGVRKFRSKNTMNVGARNFVCLRVEE